MTEKENEALTDDDGELWPYDFEARSSKKNSDLSPPKARLLHSSMRRAALPIGPTSYK